MSKPKLKLAKLTDTKPSKLSVSLPPDLLGDLEVYASIYEQTYGEKQAVGARIPSMLAGLETVSLNPIAERIYDG